MQTARSYASLFLRAIGRLHVNVSAVWPVEHFDRRFRYQNRLVAPGDLDRRLAPHAGRGSVCFADRPDARSARQTSPVQPGSANWCWDAAFQPDIRESHRANFGRSTLPYLMQVFLVQRSADQQVAIANDCQQYLIGFDQGSRLSIFAIVAALGQLPPAAWP